MDINIAIKSLTKKHLKTERIHLPNLESPCTLAQLLQAMVTQQVTAFNARITQKLDKKVMVNKVMDDNYLDILLNTGKVGFNEVYNDSPADVEEAINNALQSYVDGLFAVFINDKQIEHLDSLIDLQNHSQISLVRLTFLTGGFA